MTMSLCMPPLCGIGQNLHCVMMQYSLHHASAMHLRMRSNGPHLTKDLIWVHIYKKLYQGVLGLLMALLLKFTSLNRMKLMANGLMGGKKDICNEQHYRSRPSWVFHLHRHYLS
jgi:hypothetical protein